MRIPKLTALLLLIATPLATPLFVLARSRFGLGSNSPINFIPDILLTLSLVYVLLKDFKLFKKEKLLRWAGYYIVFSVVVSLFTAKNLNGYIAGLLYNLRPVSALVLGWYVARKKQINAQQLRKMLLCVSAAVIIFGLLQMYILPKDFLSHFGYSIQTIKPFITIDDNPNLVRILSTTRGPNPLGAYLVLPILLSFGLFMKEKKLWQFVLLAGGVIVLYGSGSRSAGLGLFVGLGLMLVIKSKQLTDLQRFIKPGIWLAIPILVTGLILLPSVRDSSFARQSLLHDDPKTGAVITTNQEHWNATKRSFNKFLQQPFGCGLGCSGPASRQTANSDIPENYYLQIARETGFIGFFLFMTFLSLIAKNLYQKRHIYPEYFAAFIGLSLVGLLLHVWADQEVVVTFWIAAGSVIANSVSIIKSDTPKNLT
jgi:O-Antigen ligase